MDLVLQPSTLPNQSDILLIPYANVEGHWNLHDEFVFAFGSRMRKEGTFTKVFYDGNVKNEYDFVQYVKRPANVVSFFFSDNQALGAAWLNGIHDNRAFAHFTGLKTSKGRTVDVGRLALGYWFGAFDFLDVVLGLTPADNKLALRFIERLGFTVLGEIPSVIADAYQGEKRAGVLSYYARV